MDLWGTGCVFFEVLSLFPLFPGNDELDQINKIHDIMGTPAKSVFDNFQKHATHMKFNFTPKEATNLRRLAPHVSAEALDLIEKLLTYVEDQRFTAKQALNHPYFKEFRSQEKSFALDPLLITENPEDEQKTLKRIFEEQESRVPEEFAKVPGGEQQELGDEAASRQAQHLNGLRRLGHSQRTLSHTVAPAHQTAGRHTKEEKPLRLQELQVHHGRGEEANYASASTAQWKENSV
eukprot:TRINITY_DN1152_c0_g1_i12.p1 TRINITY_DN1152_c0_g1~~TRINITY_DN1152_c0_g1_i12.p1  ORF type:complete len:235 (+),score=30.30 TRINITY_DN1152_c0_g1_i12:858-1562(+)